MTELETNQEITIKWMMDTIKVLTEALTKRPLLLVQDCLKCQARDGEV